MDIQKRNNYGHILTLILIYSLYAVTRVVKLL